MSDHPSDILAGVNAVMPRLTMCRVVAVEWMMGEWTAYVHPMSALTVDSMTDRWVLEHGKQLSERDARWLFPQLADRTYRA
jgi:hypothetical protein